MIALCPAHAEAEVYQWPMREFLRCRGRGASVIKMQTKWRERIHAQRTQWTTESVTQRMKSPMNEWSVSLNDSLNQHDSVEQCNQWTDDSVNECIDESMNQWMTEFQWADKSANEIWVDESMNQWMNERMDIMDETMDGRMDEWTILLCCATSSTDLLAEVPLLLATSSLSNLSSEQTPMCATPALSCHPASSICYCVCTSIIFVHTCYYVFSNLQLQSGKAEEQQYCLNLPLAQLLHCV